MYNFEVIDLGDPRWDEIIRSARLFDFHHTSFYHKIDSGFNCKLIHVTEGYDFVALPLVLRPITGTEWSDATSVYGYAGPITNKENFERFSSGFWIFFKSNFESFCRENNIISVFSRLHPLLSQKKVFDNFGEVLDLNKTVGIDLMLPPSEQRKQYRKSTKSEINQLRGKGFNVEEANSKADIDSFVGIYYETMDRVEASPSYYFSKEYFYSFLENEHFNTALLLAKFEERIIAGAIFTITEKIMQYHLAGTTKDFIAVTPMKLILDEARLKGNNLGLDFFHLGGGVGGSDDDSLFRFKSGFSDVFYQFSVWRYVSDKPKYDYLVKEKGLENANSNFFPLYRM